MRISRLCTMPTEENCIKVTQLPQDISEDKLRIIFQNKRNQGGGPVEKIILNRDGRTCWALVYFKSPQAVYRILSRGNSVTIDDQVAEVSKNDCNKNKDGARQVEAAKSKNMAESKMTQKSTQPDKVSIQPRIPAGNEQPIAKKLELFEEIDGIHSLARRTIKATVQDIWKSRESFVLYMEDETVSEGTFDEASMLLDCLNQVLYVTFDDEKGALRFCVRGHGHDSNFARVEMSTDADFETYPNKVSVHGFNLKQKEIKQRLKEFAYRKTGMQVVDVIQWNEARSAILVFDENDCQDITEICWKLRTECDGTKILSAPVFTTKSVIVTGLPSNFDNLLHLYFANSRSGGGPIDSVEFLDDVAIVTFKSEDHFFGVLEKEDHCLEGFPLQIEAYYECLSKSAYKRCSSLTRTGIRSPAQEKSAFDRDESAEQECSVDENEMEDFDFSSAKEISIDLDKKDIILLQNHAGILEEFQHKHRPLKVMLDAKSSTAKIRGDDSNRDQAATQLLQMTMKFKSQKISSLSKSQLEVLKSDWIQHEVNAEFLKGKQKAVFVLENNAAFIYYVEPINFEDLINIVKSQAHEETKKCSDPNTKLLFATKEGSEFLSKLCKGSDGSSLGFLVRHDEETNSFLIVAPYHKKIDLHHRIDAFLEENVLDVKTIKCTERKIQFLNKFKNDTFIALREKSRPLGVMIEEKSDSFKVTGKKDKVASVERELIEIRDSILIEDFSLLFFGIEQYMYAREGKRIKAETESKLACCIYLPTDFAANRNIPASNLLLKPIPESSKIATAYINGYLLHFVQIVDVLGLNVKAVIQLEDKSEQQSFIGSLKKATFAEDGDQIQANLLETLNHGDVSVTCSVIRKTLQNVIKTCITSEGGDAIKSAVNAALQCASKKRFASVGIQNLKNLRFTNQNVCLQTMSAIKDHIESEETSPGDIYLCDTSDKMLSALLNQCELSFPEAFIDHLILLDQKPCSSSKNKFKYGSVVLTLSKGDITLEKCDGIVCSIKSSMNLSACESAMQQTGVAKTSACGLQCESIYFVSQDMFSSTWDQGVVDVLTEAASDGATSIALPLLGSGGSSSNLDVTTKKFLAGVEKFGTSQNSSLKDIKLVLFSQDMYDFSMKKVQQNFQCSSLDNKFGCGSVTLTVKKGDLTLEKCDGIVCSIKSSMDLSACGAVSKSLLKKCGQTLQAECNAQKSAMQQTGVAKTSPCGLQCESIYFVSQDKFSSTWDQGVVDVLTEAASDGATSIALPLLGSGSSPPNMNVVMKFLAGIEKFGTAQNSTIKDIRLIIFSQDMYDFCMRKVQQNIQFSSASHQDKTNPSSGSTNKFSYGCVTLTVTKGDVTLENCDGIVCSIKSSMDLSACGAVCKSLLRKCGPNLQAECSYQKITMGQTGVAKTSACGLQCESIYFVSQDMFSSNWDQGVVDVLTEAALDGATSIALPLLGSGASPANLGLTVKKFLDGVEVFGRSQNSTLKDVRLVIFQQSMYDFFMGKVSPHLLCSNVSNQDIKKTSKGPMTPRPKVSNRIDLKLYVNDVAHAERVRKELVQSFKKVFMREEVKQEIKQLSQRQIEDLQHTAWQNCVLVRLCQNDGAVKFGSFFSILTVVTKLNALVLQAVESHYKALHEATPAAIVWQFRDEHDRWINFQSLMNVETEKEYKNNLSSCVIKDPQNLQHKLDFKAMQMFSLKKDGKTWSKRGVKIRRYDKISAGEPLPEKWDTMAAHENLKLVTLRNDGREYAQIEQLFAQMGVKDPINEIQRIQNKYLYQQYMVKKREMDLRNGKGFPNEKRLFHGTSLKSKEAINKSGFSNNYAGVNATMFGEGSYFAVHSSYSARYCEKDYNGLKHMYVVRVLVGKSTRSRQGMKYLPTQPDTNFPFDSGTDDKNQMYIIFHDAQTYPEYLISF